MQTVRQKAGFLLSFAVLLGFGLAAMFQTFESEESVRVISREFSRVEGLRAEQARAIGERISRQAAALQLSRRLFAVAGAISLLLIVLTLVNARGDARRRGDVQKALEVRAAQYGQVVEQAGDIIYRCDAAGRFLFVNQATLTMLCVTGPEIISRSWVKLVRSDYRRETRRFYRRQFAGREQSTYLEFPIIDGKGRTIWIGQNVQLLLENGKPVGFQAIARDITVRRQASADIEKKRAFLERVAVATPGLLYVFDMVEMRNVFFNREAAALLGYNVDEFPSRTGFLELIHSDDRPAISEHHEALRHAVDGEVRHLEYRMRHADGHWVWFLSRDTPFERDSNGTVRRIVGIGQDVTARRAAQDKLAWQANFDALTGLSNRHHFWTRLQAAFRRASLELSTASLCLFDIDHFKDINDRFGHGGGDEVLEAVGNIVRSELRANDIAGRLGGDEFCLVLPDTDHNEAARVAERIRERLTTQAFGVHTGSPFSVTAAFGVAEWKPQLEGREVMEAADRALYRAKSSGRNRVCVDA